MAQRPSPSLARKLVVIAVSFGVMAIGAHMLIKPERYSFARLSATGPRQGIFQGGVAWMDTHIGTRPAGGVLAGVGMLGFIITARPKPKR